MHTQLVLIQATSFCNISCKYCYLPDRAVLRRIKLETLDRIFRSLFSSEFLGEEVLFLWHAGEPLTLPISFYEDAFALQARLGEGRVKIANAMQTNGTLITDEWCAFFRKHAVHVGVSLDGPEELHNSFRLDRAGRGTHDRVLRGLARLERYDIPYTCIAVITEATVREPELFWSFFANIQSCSLGLNPEEVEGVNQNSSLFSEEKIASYRHFVKRLLELNDQQENRREVKIREFEKLQRLLCIPNPVVQAQTNVPMAIISFDTAGNFSTFSPELLSMTHVSYGDFLFGNVFENRLEDIFSHPQFQRVYGEIKQGIERCRSCNYFSICGGGSPSNKLFEHGTFDADETMACRLQIQAPADALLEHLEAKYHLVTS